MKETEKRKEIGGCAAAVIRKSTSGRSADGPLPDGQRGCPADGADGCLSGADLKPASGSDPGVHSDVHAGSDSAAFAVASHFAGLNVHNNEPFTPAETAPPLPGVRRGRPRKLPPRRTLAEELERLLREGDTLQALLQSLIDRAAGGDLKAFELIRELLGEKPSSRGEAGGGITIELKGEVQRYAG